MEPPDIPEPDEQTRVALIAAAIAHLGASDASAFLVPVPGTNPPIYVATGTLDNLELAIALKNAH